MKQGVGQNNEARRVFSGYFRGFPGTFLQKHVPKCVTNGRIYVLIVRTLGRVLLVSSEAKFGSS